MVTSFGLLVSFKWSKTNQTGARPLTLPLLFISDTILCPVRVYLNMCLRLLATASLPTFFIAQNSKGCISITKAQLVSGFRKHLARIGVSNAMKFRGHSFRRGGATWAFQNGVPGEFIQIYGGWASNDYKCYLEFSDDIKLRVVKHLVRSLNV